MMAQGQATRLWLDENQQAGCYRLPNCKIIAANTKGASAKAPFVESFS